MMGGAISRPTKLPTSRPPNTVVTANDQSCFGIFFAIIAVAEAGATPSPNPTSVLEKHNSRRECAAQYGAMTVPKDQMRTPHNSTVLPPSLEAIYPPGN